MVDATAFGTTIVKVRSRSELDMIVERFGPGESVTLVRDLTFDYEFLEEGRSLSLVGKHGCNSRAEMHALIESECEEMSDGKFKPAVQFSFFQKSAVEKSVAAIAEQLKGNDKKREDKDFDKEAYEDAGIGKEEKFEYNMHLRKWDIPELTGSDGRQGDARYVAGGAPQPLGSVAPPATSAGSPPIKKITKYMTGEPDNEKRNQKVYITDEDVVNCDESRIRVDFKQTSYSVKADTESTTYVLGPIECGHILPAKCSWRLSKGKKLTLTLTGTQPEIHPAMAKQMADATAEANAPAGWQIIGAVVAVVFALLFLAVVSGK